MKKIFTILCACLFTFGLTAQTTFGVKAGLNSTALGDSEEGPDGARIGMHIGGVVSIPFSDVVGLNTGLIYSMKGATDSDADHPWKFDYLEIPMDIAFNLGESFYLGVGPYLGILLSATYDGEKLEYIDQDGDEKNAMKSIDFGLNIGMGWNLNESMFIDLKYGIGLMDISAVETYTVSSSGSISSEDFSTTVNGALQVGFGYRFGN